MYFTISAWRHIFPSWKPMRSASTIKSSSMAQSCWDSPFKALVMLRSLEVNMRVSSFVLWTWTLRPGYLGRKASCRLSPPDSLIHCSAFANYHEIDGSPGLDG